MTDNRPQTGIDLITDRAADLAGEIWWDEHFTIGDANFSGQIKPDPSAARCMVRAILDRSGFGALYDAGRPLAKYIAGWADLAGDELVSVRVDALRNLADAIAKAEGE